MTSTLVLCFCLVVLAHGTSGETYWADIPNRERPPAPIVPPPNNKYETTNATVEGKINIHVVPHSHDDTGWQITTDQYFYENVQYILHTVVDELWKDPNRHFIFVETAFLARWMEEAYPEQLEKVKVLVAEGRLELINGGWCMHDEAATLYSEMVDQTTRGHQYIYSKFGTKASPRGTWQIDPFGHSNTQAWLMGAESGMNSMFWGRMDFQDFNDRAKSRNLEWIWRGSKSRGAHADIFGGQLYGTGQGNYGTWFSFEFAGSEQVIDNPNRHGYNIDKWIDRIVKDAETQGQHFKLDHQIWPAGSDFNYQDSSRWYRNIDKLIHHVNKDGRVHMLYSTPTRYADAKYDVFQNVEDPFELREDDLFPLGDRPTDYWTGYYTSRPALKRNVRYSTNVLQAARQMEVASKLDSSQLDKLYQTSASPKVGKSFTDGLEGSVGVATHHDGISGTERQSVSDDYELNIAQGTIETYQGVSAALGRLLFPEGTGEVDQTSAAGDQPSTADVETTRASDQRPPPTGNRQEELERSELARMTAASLESIEFDHCSCSVGENCFNISMCAFTAQESVDEFVVTVWNSMGRPYTGVVRLPVRSGTWEAETIGENSAALSIQVVPIDQRTKNLSLLYVNSYNLEGDQLAKEKEKFTNHATHVAYVAVETPPIGFSTFRLKKTKLQQQHHEEDATPMLRAAGEKQQIEAFRGFTKDSNTVENEMYKLTFNPDTNELVRVLNKKSNVEKDLSILVGYYSASKGGCTKLGNGKVSCGADASGAYVFRPNSTRIYVPESDDGLSGQILETKVTHGSLVTEVYQTLADWSTYVIRLYKEKAFIEVEWTVGPIPLRASREEVDDKLEGPNTGKEVIFRYKSSIKNKGIFNTDSNGMEMVERIAHGRPSSYPTYVETEPAAGNYYPVNAMIAIEDEEASLAVLTDVSQGGSSMEDGDVELMVHRRLLYDDIKGVQEPLNETMCGCNDINAPPGQMGAHGHLGDGGCWCEGLTVRGKHWLILDTPENANEARRQLTEELNFAPQLAFLKTQGATPTRPAFSMISQNFPENVRLMTLTNNYADFHDGKLLLRVLHQYAAGEHPELSKPARISLSEIFNESGFRIIDVEEVSLTGNQDLKAMDARRLRWKPDEPSCHIRTYLSNDDKLEFSLGPMEMRTFFVKLE